MQQIQKEYQDFMEKVRSKAQGAIDSANREYQGTKTLLSSRMGIMVDYLQAGALPRECMACLIAQPDVLNCRIASDLRHLWDG